MYETQQAAHDEALKHTCDMPILVTKLHKPGQEARSVYNFRFDPTEGSKVGDRVETNPPLICTVVQVIPATSQENPAQ